MTMLDVVPLPADQLPGDAVAVFYFEDQKPLCGPAAVLDWRLDGQLTRALMDGQLTGRAGEHAVYQNNSKLATDWALFVGGGKWEGLCVDTYRALLRHLLTAAQQAGFYDLSLCLPLLEELDAWSLEDLVKQEMAELKTALVACRLSLVDSLTG